MATISSNVSAPRASFLVANIIAKVKKSLTPTKESILPGAEDSFRELLGEAAVQKVAPFPLLASTIAKWIDETAGYWDTIVGKINESLWYAIQLNKSTDVDQKATMLVSMSYIFRSMCTRICSVHFSCQPIPQLQNYLSLWNYISGKLNWSFCVGLCTQWLPWLDGFLVSLVDSKRSLLNVSQYTLLSIEKCWLAEKCHLNLTMFAGCD